MKGLDWDANMYSAGKLVRLFRICLEMYLNNKIDDGIVMIIKCPSCEYQLSYDEVTINIGEPKREKYAKFRTL